MIIETKYICEVCRRKFKDKKEAAKCEKEHKAIVGCSCPIFSAHDTKRELPESVLVEFSDGKSARYYRR